MPRPKKPGVSEPKKRSRNGCCGEEKPFCLNCEKQGETCDYSIRLNWEGRSKRKPSSSSAGAATNILSPPVLTPSFQTLSPPDYHSPTESSPNTSFGFSPRPLAGRSIRTRDSIAEVAVHGLVGEVSQYATANTAASCYPPPAAPPTSSAGILRPFPNHHNSKFEPDLSTPPVIAGEEHSKLESRLSYPSPTESSIASPKFNVCTDMNGMCQPVSHAHRVPGLQNISPISPTNESDPISSHPAKRLRSLSPRYSDSASILISNDRRFGSSTIAPSRHRNLPLSPLTPSRPAADDPSQPKPHREESRASSDLHRVSVSSLLSQSAATEVDMNQPSPHDSSTSCLPLGALPHGGAINYGVDCGYPDLDLNRNNDSVAIERPTLADKHKFPLRGDSGSTTPESDTDPHKLVTVFSKGGYYARPVPINIPRYLVPLPSTLLQNPINLLYFHHFLNHTARILVPHDCPSNPFACVLPAMAVQDTTLMNLLLAYSASHRARLLGHAEPSNRIAHWVHDVFPTLRHALDNPQQKVSATILATAIMLVSLKIISPSTFEVPIPWQSHLKLARELFMARRNAQCGRPADQADSFLGDWLRYLDIFGSISCKRAEPPLFEGSYYMCPMDGSFYSNPEYEIDCFTGFTLKCGSFLARVAKLTHQCDWQRVGAAEQLSSALIPSTEVREAAEALLQDMNNYRVQGYMYRTHHSKQDAEEMAAVDEAYHLAGQLHLYRRVLARSSSDPHVIEAVKALVHVLNKVARSGTAEVCLLFPLFTAGCERLDLVQRQEVKERVQSFEGVGLKQIRKARRLMQHAWEENVHWTSLANGEFLG
ncbi:hypothetical protein AJ80_09739 [Polytolypa hystricis UAMH7299]|uniref:Zn(2)-C6 fungal-type domain-containing protein n=1 Tax=Polytolypa hystricis (strain UAMH7299) TaxID=1447883 RepID=A0A2B7WKR6_POLH7|nr:hypothetical protein AJ80_09739 [Polytolypa hystricis UAMH7299]